LIKFNEKVLSIKTKEIIQILVTKVIVNPLEL
jgi:hypothetical protein